ncbi:MAG: L-2-amino-thiazoline-4-carboxylic acid hydrolase [Anaerolineae bacterium]|jgi:hypothetical protein
MSYVPCRQRTFELSLASEMEYHAWHYLNWLKHLAERLGREPALALWQDAFETYDEKLLSQILATGWQAVAQDERHDIARGLSEVVDELFPAAVEGVSAAQARAILARTPPFRQIAQHLPEVNVKRQITTYEALHLFRDGLACLAEALIARYGKQGELIAYDALLEEWPPSPDPRMSVENFMSRRAARFAAEPEEADIFSAGLEVEFVRASDSEVVTRVVECEWARYFLERHPGVGYLLACSLDNAAYRSFNDRLRLQRRSTLMEGGPACDFRVYALETTPPPESADYGR